MPYVDNFVFTTTTIEISVSQKFLKKIYIKTNAIVALGKKTPNGSLNL